MLRISQFRVDEAWIFFKINGAPIPTEIDGDFDVFVLMDAASLYILGSEFVPAGTKDGFEPEMRRLLDSAYAVHALWPEKLFVTNVLPTGTVVAEAEREGIAVTPVANRDISRLTHEAKQAFAARFGGTRGAH